MFQKVAQRTSIDQLEQCGFFPLCNCDQGEPSSHEAGNVYSRLSLATDDISPSFFTQVKMLIWREARHIRRDKSVTTARVLQGGLMAALIGVIFNNVGQTSTATATNIQSQFGAIVIVSCAIMMGPAQAALLAFPEERPIFLREYSTKHYSVFAYFVSRLVAEAILGAVQCVVVVSFSMLLASTMKKCVFLSLCSTNSWQSLST